MFKKLTHHFSTQKDDASLQTDTLAIRPTLNSGRVNPRPSQRKRVDVIISPNEISSAHGTGILLARILDDRANYITIRSHSHYGGRQDISPEQEFILPDNNMDRLEIVRQTADWLETYDVDSIVCVPYFESDLLICLAAKAATGAPLALWIMDDHCLFSKGIDKEVMAEAISRADVVFAISPELRDAYEKDFGRAIHVLPPLVAAHQIRAKRSPTPIQSLAQRRAVLIGNIWSQTWLDNLLGIIEQSGLNLQWFTANPYATGLTFNRELAARKGLTIEPLPDTETYIKAISDAAFVLVPTAAEFGSDPAGAISRLSLPTRVPFIVATSGTPIVVLGNKDSSVGRFIRRFGLGRVSAYDKEEFASVIEEICKADEQSRIRKAAAKIAPAFRSDGIFDYIKNAAKLKGYIDNDRFSDLFSTQKGEYKVYRDRPAPPWIHPSFVDIYECMIRLKKAGYQPDLVIDVGASTGIWSYYVSSVFSSAKYLLFEPMLSRYQAKNIKADFLIEEKAAGAEPGLITFNVSDDLYNSSLIAVNEIATQVQEIEVEVTTVDKAVADHALSGKTILKIDVQYAEHLVLAGAEKTLASMADFVLLELTFSPPVSTARDFTQMVNLMDSYGFRPFDDIGGWRSPTTGFSDQKDLMFIRKDFSFSGPKC